MPKNGDDLLAAERIVQMGYPAVGPVMRDMVRWMRVAESPVADVFAAFFGRLGEPAIQEISEGLMRDNCWLRHKIFTRVLPNWSPEAVGQLVNVFSALATAPPDSYDNDLRSVAVLMKYRLADTQWLKGWIEFKKERLTLRSTLLNQIEEELRNI
ncbi:MAG: hypothetical protein HY043_05030 [Verrucomicrobia bacterium]|nr:hypothetical protein [Verrucomicrobiota bacterium]